MAKISLAVLSFHFTFTVARKLDISFCEEDWIRLLTFDLLLIWIR